MRAIRFTLLGHFHALIKFPPYTYNHAAYWELIINACAELYMRESEILSVKSDS